MELAGQGNRGYAMAALLVGMSVMAVLMSALLPVWSHMATREKEEELIFRGRQYARAIGLFQRKYANTAPPTIDLLVEQRFLRKKYKDPITNDDFQPIYANQSRDTGSRRRTDRATAGSERIGEHSRATAPAIRFRHDRRRPTGRRDRRDVEEQGTNRSSCITAARNTTNGPSSTFRRHSGRGSLAFLGRERRAANSSSRAAAGTVRHAAWWTARRQFPAAAAGIRSAEPASCQRAEQSIRESESEWFVHDAEWLDHLHARCPGPASSGRRTVTLRSKRSRRAARDARPGCRHRRGSDARDS